MKCVLRILTLFCLRLDGLPCNIAFVSVGLDLSFKMFFFLAVESCCKQ